MQLQTVFQAGNTQAVSLSKPLGFLVGQKVFVDKIDDQTVVIKKADNTLSTIAGGEFDRWLKEFFKENGEILDELAER